MENMHPIIKSLVEAAPYIKAMRENGYMVGVTDREKTLRFIPNDIIDLSIPPNTMLPPEDPMLEVMKTGKPMEVKVGKELYGIPFKAYYCPVRDEKNQIIGGLALGRELEIEEKLIDITNTIVQSIEQIGEAINHIAKGSQQQEEISQNMVETMFESVSKQEETDDILNFIKNVSRQTNLLSLNAQIEAARVGMAGKGFAIVANEMKKLGNSSSGAVSNIETILDEVKSINEKIKALVNTNNEITSEQAGAIEEILASMGEVSNAVSILKGLSNKL